MPKQITVGTLPSSLLILGFLVPCILRLGSYPRVQATTSSTGTVLPSSTTPFSPTSYYSYTTGEYPKCGAAGGFIPYIGDGWCDSINSNEYCEYDGGDCCTCTCNTTAVYDCGIVGYDCQDPTVPEACVNESDAFIPDDYSSTYYYYESSGEYPNCTSVGGFAGYISDGLCDASNSNEECAYDGGDCCSCTCVDTEDFTCGDGGYFCQDPTVSEDCVNASDSFLPPYYYTSTSSYYSSYYTSTGEFPNCTDVGGFVPYIGDGWCDSINVNDECAYDGGDCCTCTCNTTAVYECGIVAYDCQDPTVPLDCVNESDAFVPEYSTSTTSYYYTSTTEYSVEYPNCTSADGYPVFISDGDCDVSNSIEECGYDGGDCCSCTCIDTEDYTCGVNGGYLCQDPTVSEDCMEESASFVPPTD